MENRFGSTARYIFLFTAAWLQQILSNLYTFFIYKAANTYAFYFDTN